MKTVTVNTKRFQGKVYVEMSRENYLRVFTDPENPERKHVTIHGGKHQVYFTIYRSQDSYVYSPVKKERIEIPPSKRVWSYDYYERRYPNKTVLNPSLLIEILPAFKPCFDDEKLRIETLSKELKAYVKRWEQRAIDADHTAKDYRDRAAKGKAALKNKQISELELVLKLGY